MAYGDLTEIPETCEQTERINEISRSFAGNETLSVNVLAVEDSLFFLSLAGFPAMVQP